MFVELRRPGSIVLIGAAVVLGLALVGTALTTTAAVRAASTTLARGQADLLRDELRLELGRGMPTTQELANLLVTFSEEQLGYVAMLGEDGETLVEAGHSAAPPGYIDTNRALRGPPGPSFTWFGPHLRVAYRRMPRPPRFSRRIGAGAELVFEFVPQLAGDLEQRSRRSVAIGGIGSLGALLLAALYLRQRRRADAAQRAEASSRRLAELGQMSAVLAHELRNPLASLKGHAQLLVRGLPSGAQHDKAELVVSEAVRLERLSNDLLEFVRTGTIERSPTDLGVLLRELGEERGTRVTVTVAADVPPVSIDPERFRQVLGNLLDNALQAGEGAVELSLQLREGSVELAVRDHGSGIDPADLPRLFQPFFTTKTRGTGLGLAVARQIVELHGGTISADNADGGGARFRVRLPTKS